MAEAEYVPTPEEIRAGCALIQATWSDSERRLRAGLADGRVPYWTAPLIHTPARRRGNLHTEDG